MVEQKAEVNEDIMPSIHPGEAVCNAPWVKADGAIQTYDYCSLRQMGSLAAEPIAYCYVWSFLDIDYAIYLSLQP